MISTLATIALWGFAIIGAVTTICFIASVIEDNADYRGDRK